VSWTVVGTVVFEKVPLARTTNPHGFRIAERPNNGDIAESAEGLRACVRQHVTACYIANEHSLEVFPRGNARVRAWGKVTTKAGRLHLTG
jgi:hypothetical protein